MNVFNGSKTEEQQQWHADEILRLTEEHQVQVLDLIVNRHVPRVGVFDTILDFLEKNSDDGQKGVAHLPYYVIKCQRNAMLKLIFLVRERYPNMIIIEPVCCNANAIHC